MSQGSTVVWRSSRIAPNAGTSQTVQPGGNATLNAVWNGRPNQRGVKRLGSGTYTMQVTEGGYTASATFRVVWVNCKPPDEVEFARLPSIAALRLTSSLG